MAKVVKIKRFQESWNKEGMPALTTFPSLDWLVTPVLPARSVFFLEDLPKVKIIQIGFADGLRYDWRHPLGQIVSGVRFSCKSSQTPGFI